MNAKAFFKALVLTLSGTLLSLPIALLAILGTEPGSRWLIQTVISVTELDAEIKRIDGTLLGELTLNNSSIVAKPNKSRWTHSFSAGSLRHY